MLKINPSNNMTPLEIGFYSFLSGALVASILSAYWDNCG
jgi:hypothetical protein